MALDEFVPVSKSAYRVVLAVEEGESHHKQSLRVRGICGQDRPQFGNSRIELPALQQSSTPVGSEVHVAWLHLESSGVKGRSFQEHPFVIAFVAEFTKGLDVFRIVLENILQLADYRWIRFPHT